MTTDFTRLERQRSRPSHRRTIAGLSSAQTFISCSGTQAAVADGHAQMYTESADQLRTGRFSSGYLVPLDRLPTGMELIPLIKCHDGNRVTGPSDFTTEHSSEDLIWAVKAMYERVLPRVAQDGNAQQLLQESDSRQNRGGVRSLTNTYRWFFGEAAITVDLADDGRFWIANGAHRVWVARQLGITHVPARVVRLS